MLKRIFNFIGTVAVLLVEFLVLCYALTLCHVNIAVWQAILILFILNVFIRVVFPPGK